jgi:hypothetical protein
MQTIKKKRTAQGDVLLERDSIVYVVKVFVFNDVAKIMRKFRHKDLAWQYFDKWDGVLI